MINNFGVFASAVRRRFDELASEPLFRVTGDGLWEHYLASFPPGSNPLFRERTEHDCSCCRHFVRDVANVVAIQNGTLTSVWDLNGLPEPYQTVADRMAEAVKSRKIVEPFLTRFAKIGQEVSHERTESGVREWEHFSVVVPKSYLNTDPQEVLGRDRTTYQVMLRGLRELSLVATGAVLELIDARMLYRGEEHLSALQAFRDLQERAIDAREDQLELLCWSHLRSPVARFRNTAIGTLVDDLSQGVDLGHAVKSFETKVAPEHYKRPTALITPSMIRSALKTIAELGLEDALHRRHARLEDVSVNSVLFVDRAVRGRMKDGIEGLLMSEVKPQEFAKTRAIAIGIEEFVREIVPQITSISLYLDNSLLSNFVSLTAPVHADSGQLFRWGNDFAWSYDGNVTDSIKDKVKRAGGRVEGVELRVSLAWHNYDDLDLHCVDPHGNHIFFRNKANTLDVDMNAGGGHTREPVENMRWVHTVPGNYHFWVNQYQRRESIDVGFEIEIEYQGHLMQFNSPRSPVTDFDLGKLNTNDGAFIYNPELRGGSIPQEKWGLKSQSLIRVNSIVLSPNHWDAPVGNKHYFFILEGANNPEPTRGFYNEFLSAKLEPHRKVFEVLADKMKCPPQAEQLSGVGFSSTLKDKVTVVAMGPDLNKTFTIVF